MHSTKTLLTALAAAGLIASAQADVVAQFDFGETGGNVAAGYAEVGTVFSSIGDSSGEASASGTQNGITVTVTTTNGINTRSRGTTSSSYINEALNPGAVLTPMLQDYIFDDNNGTDAELTLVLTGLVANTEYNLTALSFETSGGILDYGADFYVGSVDPGNLLANWSRQRSDVLDAEDFIGLNVTSNGSGEVTIVMDPVANEGWGTAKISGLIVDQVVPEPTSLALLSLGGLCVLRRRRG